MICAGGTADLVGLPIHSRLICVPRFTNSYLDSKHPYSAIRRPRSALSLVSQVTERDRRQRLIEHTSPPFGAAGDC